MKELLKIIRDNHMLVEVIDGQLSVYAGEHEIDPDLIATIRSRKEELVRFLSGQGAPDTIPALPWQPDYALSPAQRRMWILNQFEDAGTAYIISGAYILKGGIDREALQYALDRLVERHEILRTVFVANGDGEIRQVVREAGEARMLISEEGGGKPFNLVSGPLLRAVLTSRGEQEWAFLFEMHHIIGDAWSIETLVREWVSYYRSAAGGVPYNPAPLSIQYKDYTGWQLKRLQDHVLKDDRQFWLGQLSGELPVLSFPADRQRPPVKTYNGGIVRLPLPGSLSAALQDFCRQNGGTLFMGLTAAVNALLYKYTGQTDVILGSPVSGRERIELEDQIGLYVNTVLLRTRFDAGEGFVSLFRQVRRTATAAYAHQAYPFDELVEECRVPRDTSRNPLFDVAVSLTDDTALMREAGGMDGWQISRLEEEDCRVSKFDLAFVFYQSDKSLRLDIEYNTDLYMPESIQRLSDHFLRLLAAALQDTILPLWQLEMLAPREKDRILREFNDTAYDHPTGKTVVTLFEEQASLTPGNIAIISGNIILRYEELNSEANRLAHCLRSLYGVKTGDPVGILLDRSEWMAISVLAVLKAGGAYIPMDLAYPEDRKQYMRADSGCRWVIDQAFLDTYKKDRDRYDTVNPATAAGTEDLAYIVYTSGSTGRPKGVMVEHRTLNNLCQWHNRRYHVTAADRATLYAGVGFDAAVWEFFPYMIRGACLYVVPEDIRLHVDALSLYYDTHAITVSFLPTQIAEQFITSGNRSLRYLLTGGDKLNTFSGSDIRLVNNYGPTESTVVATSYEVQGWRPNIPIGRPIDNTRIYILGSHQELLPIGVCGEIYIGGAGLARGYLHQPGLTNEKFIADPFSLGQRLYRTGDLGRWLEDGNIEFLGRSDYQLKIRGYRIEPGEIENVLLQFPGIGAAVVAGRPVSTGEKELVAYYTADNDPGTQALIAWLSARLPAYMVPRYYVVMEALPMNANGKLDRQQLPAPEVWEDGGTTAYTMPADAVEQQLTGIWQEILGRERIGSRHDFFSLGGHSLKVTRLASRIYQTFHVRVTISQLFTNPVLREQAGLIRRLHAMTFEAIPDAGAASPEMGYPLSSSQQRIWTSCQIEEGNIAFNMPGAYQIDGPLDPGLLQQSFADLVDRHEILRTTFRMNASGAVRQYITPTSEYYFAADLHDLRTVYEQQSIVAQLFGDDFSRPFDLDRGPLIRVQLLWLEDTRWILTCNLHHIICDGWSMDRMISELGQVYDALSRDSTATLPPLRIQYKDYAAWQQQQLHSDAMETHRSYWLRQLGGRLPVLQFPSDNARPAMKSYRGAVHSFTIAPPLVKGLQGICRQHGCTLFMGLLAVIDILLFRYTGQEDLVVGTPIAGRDHPDLEDQLGFYLNNIALRVRVKQNDRLSTLLDDVRKTTLDAYEHQSFPFDELVDELHIRRDLSRNPLFDVMVLLQNFHRTAQTEPNTAGLQFKRFEGWKSMVSKYDLVFYFREEGNAVHGDIEYNTDIFHSQTIEAIHHYLVSLLEIIIAHPHSTIGELVYISDRPAPLSMQLLPPTATTIACSEHQKRLWFIDQFEKNFLYEHSPVYHNMPLLVWIGDSIDLALLNESIGETIKDLDILRTSIISQHNEPFARTTDVSSFQGVCRHDWADIGDEEMLKEKALAIIEQPFQLESDVLVRFDLAVCAGRQHLLIITAHHAIIDRPSLQLLYQNIWHRYTEGGQSPEDKTAPAYASFSAWQNGLSRMELDLQAFYWKKKLKDAAVLYLDTDHPREHIHIYKAATVHLDFPAGIDDRLGQWCDRHSVAPMLFLHTCFQVMLHRYTGMEELVTGALYDQRDRIPLRRMIGPVSNLVTLKTNLTPDTPFTGLLDQVTGELRRSIDAADMPFEKVVLEVDPGKDMSRTALFDVLMHYEENTGDEKIIELNRGLGKYDLNLLVKRGSRPAAHLTYNAVYFSAARMNRMLRHFFHLVDVFLEDHTRSIGGVSLLDDEEQRQLMTAFNVADQGYPMDKTIIGLFEEQVARTPHHPAVVFQETMLTYDALNRWANRLGAYLTDRYHVGPDDLVGVMLDRSEWLIIALLGVLKAGGAYVPVDPSYPPERIDHMITDSACKLVIDEAELHRFRTLAGSYEDSDPIHAGRQHNLAYVIYTSGTTGKPKGTLIDNRNLVRLFVPYQRLFDFGPADTWTLFHSVCFDFSVWEMYGALLFGGRLVVVPALAAKDTRVFLQLLIEQRVTILNQTPSAFYNLIREEQEAQSTGLCLRYIIFGGEALSPGKLVVWRQRHPDAKLINMYGITETTVHVTYKEITEKEIALDHSNIGRPIPTLQCYVLDSRQHLLPPGVSGELYVGGAGVSRGYLNRDELTRQRFIENPFYPGQKLYRSGDKVKMDEQGEMEYVGRIDQQVKIRGYRIELGEIEHVLQKLPGIEDGIVIAKCDDTGENFLAAYVVASPDIALPEVRQSMASALPAYMVPAYFIRLDRLPLTSNGKIDRKALPDPVAAAVSVTGESTQPRNEVEKVLAAIWSELLHTDAIGIKDNFFEMGGHSLKATRMASMIHQQLGVRLPLKELFTRPVLEDLALWIQAERRTAFSSLPQAPAAGSYPLSSSQRRLWLLAQLEEASVAYNMPDAFVFEGHLNADALQEAFCLLLQRHEILRTVFREDEEGMAQQHILSLSELGFSVAVTDLRSTPGSIERVRRELSMTFTMSFDMHTGPLLRASLFRMSDTQWIFGYVMHHIISDGWSMAILIKELLHLYEAAAGEKEHSLPALHHQYKDFAVWQQQQLLSGAMQRHKDYWIRQFRDELPVFDWPGDRMRPALKTFLGGSLTHTLDPAIARSFRALAAERHATLFMTLVAAVNALLYRYTGQTDIIIGTPAAARGHVDLHGQIGFYVNTLPLRITFNGDDTFEELLDICKQITLGAYEHQEYPFDELVKGLDLPWEPGRNALFDVMVIMQNNELNEMEDTYDLPGLKAAPYPADDNPISKFDLLFTFFEADETIRMRIEYNSDIYNEDTVATLANHFQQLAWAITDEPAFSIGKLNYLHQSEVALLTETFNDTDEAYPAGKTVVTLFEEQVERTPEHPALAFRDKKLTYRQLNVWSNQFAAYLAHRHDIRAGNLAGVCLPRSEWSVIAHLAILKSGGTCVPIDPGSPADRLAYIKSDIRSSLVIDEEELARFIALHQTYPVSNPSHTSQPLDTAYVIYTSGSTGSPKGCMLPNRGIVNHLFSKIRQLHLQEGDTICHCSELYFVGGIWQLFAPLATGGMTLLCDNEEMKDIRFLLDKARMAGCRVLEVIPSQLNEYLLHEQEIRLDFLQYLILTGEKLNPYFVSKCQQGNPHLQIINTYGQTESSDVTVSYAIPKDRIQDRILIGKPIQNTRIHILSGDGQLCPAGIVGEICSSGDGLCNGYLHKPELTRQRFVPHPYREGYMMYKTGDLGRWLPGGWLEVMGRNDQQVKIRGFRIETSEIEQALSVCPGVEASIVLPQQDRRGDKYLVAWLTGEVPLDITAIRSCLEKKLPRYMLPVRYIQLDNIPLLPNGKTDIKTLLVTAEGSVPDRIRILPANDTEQRLAEIWEEVLDRTGVSMEDNFFDLGGHSLKATSLANKIRHTFRVDIRLKDIFLHATIQSLAHEIRRRGALPVAGRELIPVAIPQPDYPLSSSQRRFWVLSQLNDASRAYHMQGVYLVKGPLDMAAMNDALTAVIARHEILRTVFIQREDGEVRQVVLPSIRQALHIYDLREEEIQEEDLRAKIRADAAIPFELATGPLLRMCLYRLTNDTCIAAYTMHHIISDGWSMTVLISELLSCYDTYSRGGAHVPAPLRIQYKDYASWQQTQLKQDTLAEDRDYWVRLLEAPLPVIDLPGDNPRPAVRTYGGGALRKDLSPLAYERLRNLCRAEDSTTFMGLLSMVAVLLYKYTGQHDLVLATPIAGRQQLSLEDQIGCYVNTLPLRVRCSSEDNVAGMFRIVRALTLDAYEHQAYPFDELVDRLGLRMDKSRNPLFDVMVVLQNTAGVKEDEVRAGGLDISPVKDIGAGASKLDLVFNFLEEGEQLHMEVEYNSDIYTAATIERMVRHFELLILAATSDVHRKLEDLEYLDVPERHQILLGFNDTRAAYPGDLTLADLFHRQAAMHPDKTALVFGEKRLSYRDLEERSARLAVYLQTHYDIRPDDRVAVQLPRSESMIIAILGVIRAGGAYVPIDPAYPPDRIAYMVEDSASKAILDEAEMHRFYTTEHTYDKALLRSGVKPENLAYVLYTSGSTGRPKGCMLEHKGIVNRLEWMWTQYGYSGEDIILQKTTITFDVSVWELFLPLCWGARMVLCPFEAIAFPEAILRLIEKEKVSCLHFVPSMLNSFIAALWDQTDVGKRLCTLRCVITSGEALTPETVRAWYRKTATPLHNLYGPTEASIDVTHYTTHPTDERIPIGKPIWNTRLYITGEKGQLQPVGVPGEIIISGDGLARGYLNNEELTSLKFVPDTFYGKGRMYRTGDIGRWLPDGNIEYLGRKDDQVKIRGHRIECGEIENVLLGHPRIEAACVVARPAGGGESELVCYFVSKDVWQVADLRAFTGQRLPHYMIPGYFVRLDQLPLTPSGKVDRKKLPSPGDSAGVSATVYVAPRDATEKKLALLWEEVLATEKVGIYDNFFQLGGHSLKAIRLATRIWHAFQVRIPLQDLFSADVLERQAVLIRQTATSAASDTIGQALLQPDYPLSSTQKRMWLLEQAGKTDGLYHIHAAFEMEGVPVIASLRDAFEQLLKRHEILRTAFIGKDDGDIRQKVLPMEAIRFAMQETDLRHLAEPIHRAEEIIREEGLRPFRLDMPPLLRAGIIRLYDDTWVLYYSLHHIAGDGWSMDILFREWLLFYEAHRNGTATALPRLPIQYKDYAVWQQGQRESPDYATHREWWLTRFEKPLPVLASMSARPRPSQKTYNGDVAGSILPDELYGVFSHHMRQEGATLYMGLIAAVNILLYYYTGQQDIVLGTPIAGREHILLEDQVGLYLNTLPVRTTFSHDQPLARLLAGVRSYLLSAFSHQSYPFDDLVEALDLVPDPGRNALFDVWVVLHNTGSSATAIHNSPDDIHIKSLTTAATTVTKFDLLFGFGDIDGKLHMDIEFNTDLFTKTQVVRMARQLEYILGILAREPDVLIHEVRQRLEEQDKQLREEYLQHARARNIHHLKKH